MNTNLKPGLVTSYIRPPAWKRNGPILEEVDKQESKLGRKYINKEGRKKESKQANDLIWCSVRRRRKNIDSSSKSNPLRRRRKNTESRRTFNKNLLFVIYLQQ